MNNTTKVWGIGLGRTGTKSLCAALKDLGYNVAHCPATLKEISAPGLDGAAEGTVAFHFQYLDVRFPDSKFIATTRELRPWLQSCKRAIEELYPLERLPEENEFYDYMIRNRVNRYGCLNYNKEALMEKYYSHHYNILKYFKGRGDKMLFLDITKGGGWKPLCDFLNKPIPPTPFPVCR
tara:strand:+ start:1556 stop:2092 length:537 start_codon:yes stop_codon:yes gene_type:complete